MRHGLMAYAEMYRYKRLVWYQQSIITVSPQKATQIQKQTLLGIKNALTMFLDKIKMQKG